MSVQQQIDKLREELAELERQHKASQPNPWVVRRAPDRGLTDVPMRQAYLLVRANGQTSNYIVRLYDEDEALMLAKFRNQREGLG